MRAADYPRPEGVTEREYFGRVTEWLVRSFRRMGEDTARTHVAAAMARSIPNGERPWNPKSSTPFPVFVGKVAMNMERNARRTGARRNNVELLEGHDEALDSTPDAEEIVLQRERRRRIAAALLEDLKDSPTVLPWLKMVLHGEEPADETPEEIGLTHAQVLKARARVKLFLERWEAKHGSTVDSGPWQVSP